MKPPDIIYFITFHGIGSLASNVDGGNIDKLGEV